MVDIESLAHIAVCELTIVDDRFKNMIIIEIAKFFGPYVAHFHLMRAHQINPLAYYPRLARSCSVLPTACTSLIILRIQLVHRMHDLIALNTRRPHTYLKTVETWATAIIGYARLNIAFCVPCHVVTPAHATYLVCDSVGSMSQTACNTQSIS